jgi:hypothetical protein
MHLEVASLLAVLRNCFAHPIRMRVQRKRVQRLTAIQLAQSFNEAEGIEQIDPVAHGLDRLPNPGSKLGNREWPAI